MNIIKTLAIEAMSWLPWIIVPVIVEIIPAIGNFILLLFKKITKKEEKLIEKLPDITLIIPVYNSSATLYGCLKSVNDSTYPNNSIDVMLVDNKSKDNSFEIFQKCQLEFPTLSMQWMRAEQGKSRALNLALFNASGKYIINIDSDGKLEKNALTNMIKKFENNEEINCMTGVIITDPDLIKETNDFLLRQVQKIEFMEYMQAFLAGRNFDSELNNIFTLSGAFSAFRKSTILNTQMYNTNTICEDAHLTFQVKNNLKGRVSLCEDAIFIVDPIEGLNKLYTQRQRWQIGELEVFHMFYKENTMKLHKIITNKNIRLLTFDHTFGFPRLIWCFALLAVALKKFYDIKVIFIATGIIYIFYMITHTLYFITNTMFLSKFEDIKYEYCKKMPYLVFLPLYTFIIFFIRMAGIINSITRPSTWKTFTFTEELQMIKEQIVDDLSFGFLKKEKNNKEENDD